MEYSFDIFDKNPERLATILAENCRKRRLDKGLSRRSLSEITGIPEPTLERFPVFVMRYPNHELPNQRPTDIVPVAEGPYAALFSRAWHGRVWCMSKHTSS